MKTTDLLPLLNLEDDASLFSLIDGAQNQDLHKLGLERKKGLGFHSLLDASANFDAVYAGPLLVEHAHRNACTVLAGIVNVEGSANYVSLMTTSQPVEALVSRLAWMTNVVHEDGTEWIMRYYDPRILPHWLAVLNRDQRDIALKGIKQWLYIDVRGSAQIIHGTPALDASFEAAAPMCMSPAQHEILMARCMPYMIMDLLASDNVDELQAMPAHERYDFLATQLGRAQAYGLESVPDLKTYCMLGLMFGPGFDRYRVAAATLDTRDAGSFNDRILAWAPAHWGAMSQDAELALHS
ncbi:DUF4123 domain-containing protein [Rugamonas rivuli]|uniref:DUF4123 domain-containing protein n=1 Tax=Rugamonas rivuli TaxID=2743358 RepID=UPI00158318DC|nr:DUF4123 domain-containing protein [Rugamonas rivuli]